MVESPVVSIVIPCYNQAHFLPECLQSLVTQTLLQWEAIIVDDASTQGDVLQTVSEVKDSRCRVVTHRRNQGLGAARNTGFKEARANLVLPVDADDALEPSFLDATVAAWRQEPDVDCVYTDLQTFGGWNGVWHLSVRSPKNMLEEQWIPGPGTLMRKQVWAAAGGYPEMPPPFCGNEDWEFWIVATRHGIKAIHIPRPLYRYRITSTSMTMTTLAYHDYAIREIIYRRHRSLFDSHGAGAAFRAGGYLNSSRASLQRGARARAAWLAVRAFVLDPRKWEIRQQLLAAAVPGVLRPLAKRMAKLYRART